MKTVAFTLIKIVSTLLIAGAIGLELWNQGIIASAVPRPDVLDPVLAFGRFAVSAHLVEGAIAAFYAPSRNKAPIVWGTYTFFAGTVGLIELFSLDASGSERAQNSVPHSAE